jgi:hypothetical protein
MQVYIYIYIYICIIHGKYTCCDEEKRAACHLTCWGVYVKGDR